MKIETLLACYAAIVATAAFALNVRSWYEKGVRLNLSLMSNAIMFTGAGEDEEKNLLALTVVNRGGATTTLTHLVVLRFENILARLRCRPSKSFVIPNPQPGTRPNIPFELDPGKKWMGLARRRLDVIPDIDDGKYFIGVYGTHRDRPHMVRIPEAKSKLPPGTTTLPDQ
jgi:hypothetical protein